MKSYKDIHFSTTKPIAEVLAAIEKALKDGWWYDQQAGEKFKRIAIRDSESHYFHCDKRDSRWAATVILTRQSAGNYWLSHVLPIQDSPNPFEPDDFNAIATEFHDKFLLPLADTGDIFILDFDGKIDLEVDLGAETFRKLRAFSAGANKSTGSSHPLDEERWFEFICAFSDSGAPLAPSTLQRWMIENEGWSQERADELSLEFEFGTRLLAHWKQLHSWQSEP